MIMRRILRLIKLSAIVLALCFVITGEKVYALPDFGEEEPLTPIGINLYDMKAKGLYGGEFYGKVFGEYELTIIVVWVVWSGASRSAMMVAEENKNMYLVQGINTIGIYYEDESHPQSMGQMFYEENNYTIYSLINSGSEKIGELFEHTYAYLPVVYLVDRSGNVLDYMWGYMTNYKLNRFVSRFRNDTNIVTFVDGTDGSVIYETLVRNGDRTYYPNIPVHDDYVFRCWDKTVENITSDTVITACYTKLGDVNYDDRINSGDAALILKYTVGLYNFSDFTLKVGDINKSGSLNTGDALCILEKTLYN